MINFFKIQKHREEARLQSANSFDICKMFIEEEIHAYVAFPWRVEAIYHSTRDWSTEDGLKGWIARIYTDESIQFYDLVLDRITADNIQHYVSHALQTLRDIDPTIDAIECKEYKCDKP